MYKSNNKKSTPDNTLSFIRQSMMGELTAINEYTNHINNIENESVVSLLTEIRNDEKTHYKILLDLLRTYDKGQYEQYINTKKDGQKVEGTVSDYFEKTNENVLDFLRSDISGELEAINTYEYQIANIKDINIKKHLYNIMVDEKNHVELLNSALSDLS